MGWRRVVAYGLIIVYNVLPWITLNGKPAILLDLPARQFTFFGTTFLPTDTLLLMLFMAGVFVVIFFVTALFGRLWCGWACPQTVYMEFIYRPIERLFDGVPSARGQQGTSGTGLRALLKYVAFFVVSLHLAHTFLAYFVGAESLFQWTMQSPFKHPTGFLIVVATTVLILFDFCFFREQTCIVACPYGRFQSVMLDRSSLIISYDEKRGEPRGKARRKGVNGDVALPQVGDCVDCSLCVTTCPTGIDIRNGLQMECIGCAQCIDACDAVMTRIGRATGLIRYSSQEAMETGRRRLMRARVFLYPLLLTIIAVAFGTVLATRAPVDIVLLRDGARPYITLDDGSIENLRRLKLVNRTSAIGRYSVRIEGIDDARLIVGTSQLSLAPEESGTWPVRIVTPSTAFELGRATAVLVVSDDEGYEKRLRCPLQGPWGSTGATHSNGGGS